MSVDSLMVHEEVNEINLHDDEDELLNDLPTSNDDSKEKTENIRNDSGLETSDSMDAAKEPPPLLEMIPLSVSSQNVPLNVKITIGDSKLPELKPLPSVPLVSPEKSPNLSKQSSTSFIDSLLNKINQSSKSSESSPTKVQKSNDEDDLLEEIEQSITFETPENPNMLPTPIVKNPRAASAFINSDDDFGLQLKQPTKQSAKFDRSKMSAKSQPPKMNPPNYSNIPKPRTLAEKRMLVNTNMDFLMIEQESKIFKQIERKKKGEPINYNLIESMMNEDIPINYGPWKALQWLITQEGNYIQQHINIDGVNYRLIGSRGNHAEKYLPPQSNKPYPKIKKIALRSVRCCAGGKIKKREIDLLVNVESIKRFVLEESVEPYKRLESKNILSQLTSIKPRPLSKKIEFINKNRKLLNANEDSMFLGQYSRFKMPDIKLEVTVQNKVPLNPVAKQYLNEILPHRDMNENWINFALAPLKSEEDMEEDKKVFEFTVPYHEDKQHILVREIIKSKQDTEKLRIIDSNDDDIDEMEWTFAKNADKSDELEMEIVEVIKDLTNSVFINLNDDLFTRDDDEERIVPICPINPKEAIEELSAKKVDSKNDKSKKVLNELRRLNANVVKSDAAQVVDQDIRHRATAHLGREERELRATVIVTDSDTVLLGNTEKETRRKRVPKRFNDYLHQNAPPNEEHEKEVEIPPVKRIRQEETQTRTRTPPPDKCSSDDLKTIRQEIQKWLHVTVDINRMEVLGQVQHWCMLHNAYKCACKNVGLTLTPEYKAYKQVSNPSTANNSLNSSRATSPEREFESVDENPRRVLPVEIKNREKPKKKKIENENSEALQMEILNLSELINKGIGPIFINIYDTKENRLKPIFRSILNNKSALAYIDGFAYFIDTTRVDVRRLNFDKMRPILEHPIFIIMPKITYLTGNCDVSEDFIQLLFKRDSDVLKDITDKKQLKEISDIIEFILENARNKVKMQIGGEPSEYVREQLNMIRRDRYASDSTNSSTLTSPLHFNGKQLEKAPSPGPDSELMKEFNKIFSIRMQRLCAMIKANALGLHPLDGFVNKFYIYRWDLLLEAYESEIIFIWQVDMGENQLIITITDNKNPPVVESAKSITNIQTLSLSTDKMTELAKLVILRIENAKTRNMTVLLYGCKGYFRVCGMLNSKENYVDGFVAKPTRVTHPRLTAKIQKIYNVWYEIKKSKEKLVSEIQTSVLENNLKTSKESEIIDLECYEKEIPENSNTPEVLEIPDTPEIPEVVEKDKEMEIIEISKSVSESFNNSRSSNEEPELPKKISSMPKGDDKQNLSDRKWFLFNITNDFSDIFIKQWSRYLPYHIVIRAIKLARDKQKAVQLIPFEVSNKNWPKIFALPNAPLKFKDQHTMTNNYLIFGPYARSANSNLLLMQSDGDQKFLRDDYEKIHNIKRVTRTRCIWIYANTLKCITDSNVEMMYFHWDSQKKAKNSGDQENALKISSIIAGFNSESIRNRSSL